MLKKQDVLIIFHIEKIMTSETSKQTHITDHFLLCVGIEIGAQFELITGKLHCSYNCAKQCVRLR